MENAYIKIMNELIYQFDIYTVTFLAYKFAIKCIYNRN